MGANWKPDVDMVASFLRARTRDDEGVEVGTFNSDTRPTDEQVTSIIDTAAADMAGCSGDWIPDSLDPKSQGVIALRAAMIVELSYWPEQISTDQSPYAQLKELYDEGRVELCALTASYRPPDSPGATDEEGPPLFSFGDGLDIMNETIEVDPTTETMTVREGRILEWYGL